MTPVAPKKVLLDPVVNPRLARLIELLKTTVFSPESRNASEPILVTEVGISIDVKRVVSWNAFASMLASSELVAKIIDVKYVAFWNALAPILVTDYRIV